MRNRLITALLVAVSTATASAQVAGLAGNETNTLPSLPAMSQAPILFPSLTNSALTAPGIDEQSLFDPRPMPGVPLVPSSELSLSAGTAFDAETGRPFVDTDRIQFQRTVLFHELDLLLGADTHDSPIYFGVDHEIKFVEAHDFRPGIPVPIGMSYRGQKRFQFFTELAPIFDGVSTDSLGWGGGIGIRLSFGP